MCNKWLDISTAPRDGTPVIGWVESSKGPASGVMYVVWWREGHDGRWCFYESGRGESYSVYPSLWQPLPAPPAAQRDMQEVGGCRTPGMDWELSEKTKEQLAEIDKHIIRGL
jgi:hypothetical protein